MPKCTINGTKLDVAEGTTIIQAMTQNSQKIAHYCWHPGLSVAGVCRLCMVEIEGNPRVQIACNTVVTEGMVVNNTSEKVKDAAKWGLDFHLINHPLDCPVCDQAGECGLQEQYMEYGKYDPEMAERKVKKRKVVDLGPTVVLDSERCILCSRCVRFTTEVSKTEELGIFNRGDRSEIGTFQGKSLDNPYSLNTVDICPVGALTSKDFRFKQRVWYLKDGDTVCNGCSTGCSIKVYYNKEGLFRVKPRYNSEVNGYWMCDAGRDLYKFANKENRLTKAVYTENGKVVKEGSAGSMSKELGQQIKSLKPSEVAVLLTPQYTQEELSAAIAIFKSDLNLTQVTAWPTQDPKAGFDGILIRDDKNPNSFGLKKLLEGSAFSYEQLLSAISEKKIKMLIIAGPENITGYKDLSEKMKSFAKVDHVVWLGVSAPNLEDTKTIAKFTAIPMKSFVEKEGTFFNFEGREQKFSKVTTIVGDSLNLKDAASLLSGKSITIRAEQNTLVNENQRLEQVRVDHRKKNEFVFKRGAL